MNFLQLCRSILNEADVSHLLDPLKYYFQGPWTEARFKKFKALDVNNQKLLLKNNLIKHIFTTFGNLRSLKISMLTFCADKPALRVMLFSNGGKILLDGVDVLSVKQFTQTRSDLTDKEQQTINTIVTSKRTGYSKESLPAFKSLPLSQQKTILQNWSSYQGYLRDTLTTRQFLIYVYNTPPLKKILLDKIKSDTLLPISEPTLKGGFGTYQKTLTPIYRVLTTIAHNKKEQEYFKALSYIKSYDKINTNDLRELNCIDVKYLPYIVANLHLIPYGTVSNDTTSSIPSEDGAAYIRLIYNNADAVGVFKQSIIKDTDSSTGITPKWVYNYLAKLHPEEAEKWRNINILNTWNVETLDEETLNIIKNATPQQQVRMLGNFDCLQSSTLTPVIIDCLIFILKTPEVFKAFIGASYRFNQTWLLPDNIKDYIIQNASQVQLLTILKGFGAYDHRFNQYSLKFFIDSLYTMLPAAQIKYININVLQSLWYSRDAVNVKDFFNKITLTSEVYTHINNLLETRRLGPYNRYGYDEPFLKWCTETLNEAAHTNMFKATTDNVDDETLFDF